MLHSLIHPCRHTEHSYTNQTSSPQLQLRTTQTQQRNAVHLCHNRNCTLHCICVCLCTFVIALSLWQAAKPHCMLQNPNKKCVIAQSLWQGGTPNGSHPHPGLSAHSGLSCYITCCPSLSCARHICDKDLTGHCYSN
jgi:hypothetical protein